MIERSVERGSWTLVLFAVHEKILEVPESPVVVPGRDGE